MSQTPPPSANQKENERNICTHTPNNEGQTSDSLSKDPTPPPKPLEKHIWKPNRYRKRKKISTKHVSPNKEKSTEVKSANNRRSSWVWDHFTEYEIYGEKSSGKATETRGRCNYCGKDYAADGKKHGTGNMIIHLNDQCPKYPDRVVDEKQKTLSFQSSQDGHATLKSMSFSQDDCRLLMVKMIITDELSFRIVEGTGFQNFVKGLQPRFKIPSRFTVARDCLKLYLDEKKKLKKVITSERVCLTTDTWTSLQNMNYMCVTAHWIDKDYKLQKRILSFCIIPNHKGRTIGKMIENCLLEWGIDKLLTITVDNASANDTALNYLRNKMKGWKTAVLGQEFLHMRCSAHLLNLVVKNGLKLYNASIVKIRNAVRYVRSSPARFKSFLDCVAVEKIESKSFPCLDIETRWNSTYSMLEVALKFEKAFERLREDDSNYRKYFSICEKDDDAECRQAIEEDEENETENNGRDRGKDKYVGPPDDEDWIIASCFVKFLKIFYNITVRFSGTLTITANIFFQEIMSIQTILKSLSHQHEDPNMALVAIKMHEKFAKYWRNLDKMNFLLYIATILDPRYKMKFVKYCFDQIYENDSILSRQFEEKVQTTLTRLFEYYEHSFSSASSELRTSASTSKKTPLNIDLDETFVTGFSLAHQFAKELQKTQNTSNKSELTIYLEENCEIVPDWDSFDVLQWWKGKSAKFPILSQLAREVLAIPVSTVASESAFSTSGRILDPYRSSLNPKMVEVLVCCQNWLKSEPRTIDIQEVMKGVSFKEVEEYEEIIHEVYSGVHGRDDDTKIAIDE